MTLKLYGMMRSTCTLRVAAVLHEKLVPFQLVEIDLMNNAHKSPEYLKKQPFGQDDDGFILYESRAICRYIEAKYPSQGTKLVPTDLKERALFEQAASIELGNFDSYASSAVAEMVFKPMRGGTPDKAEFEKLIGGLSSKLDVYDDILSKQKYLAGNELTLADLFHLPYGSMLIVAGSNIMDTKPNVARWFKELQARASWVAVKDGAKSTA